MDKHALQDRIAASLAGIQALGEGDPALKGALEALDRDLRAALAESAPVEPAEQTLDDRIRTIALDFGARHPTLEPVLERLVNMLASVGI